MEKNQIRVLLAEDDRNLGNILKTILSKGLFNNTLHNGEEAIQTLFPKRVLISAFLI